MGDNVRLHAFVIGRVQGVGFRYFVLETALSMGLTGWVRNRADGSVEVTAEGKRLVLEHFLEALKKGPSMAHVQQVKSDWEEASSEFSGFQARSTV